MVRLSRIMIAAGIMLLIITACSSALEEKQIVQADLPRVEAPNITEAQAAQLRDGHNSFAFDLYHAVNREKNANLIYSPYSIWLAFSMVYGGARGETESQLADVFHFLSQEYQHVSVNALDQQLQASSIFQASENEGTPFQLNVANAVWSQQGYAFNQPYLDLLATQYGAGMRVLDFQKSAEKAREAINAWVDEKTAGRIKQIAAPGSISTDTRLVLTNAILFKAGWVNKFDEQATVDGIFTLLDSTQVTTPLMHQRAALDYVEAEDYQAIRLYYASYNAELWIILPGEGRFKAVQNELSADLIHALRLQAGMADVTLTLPKFDFESDVPLIELLTSMGLIQTFCPEGDFRGIAEGGELCIGQAVHKATIMVDEEGTEATAATMIEVPESIMEEIELTIDKPFIFTIIARDSGLILFLGQVLDPSR